MRTAHPVTMAQDTKLVDVIHLGNDVAPRPVLAES
jgi:hypothetical protein